MSSSVVEALKRSEKGKLTYCTEWNRHTLLEGIEPPKLRRSRCENVFKLDSIAAALEAIEDESLTGEREKIDSIARGKWREVSLEKTDTSIDESQNDSTFFDNKQEISVKYDERLGLEARRTTRERLKKYEQLQQEMNKMAQVRLAELTQKRAQKTLATNRQVQLYLRECERSAMKIKQESQEKHEEIMKTKIQKEEERRLKLQQLQRQKAEQARERLELANRIIKQSEQMHANTLQNLETFGQQNKLPDNILLLVDEEKRIFTETGNISSECLHSGSIEQDNLELLVKNTDRLGKLKNAIQTETTILLSQIQQEAELQRKREEAANKEEQERQCQMLKEAEAERLKAAKESNSELSAPPLPKEYKFCVSPSAYQTYTKMNEKKLQYDESSKELMNSHDPKIKTLWQTLTRAVSVPISSITDRSGSDLKSRLRSITSILKGNAVTVGTKSVSASNHPLAIKYVLNLVAKKIVQQANNQVSANFTSAFPIALVVAGIWEELPEFGDLFLAHLYGKCPYTVPFFIPKSEGQSDSKHSRLLGYEVAEDETVEVQDKYLKRMSGLVRLYAAIIQSPLPPGVHKHPHDLEHGWAWLARMLNLEPYPDISATVLYDFLAVAGHALMKVYGKQFQKLLYTLCHDYYPKIEEVTGYDNRAPVMRLKNFLEKCIKHKSAPLPEGRLDQSFWSTYHSGEVVGS